MGYPRWWQTLPKLTPPLGKNNPFVIHFFTLSYPLNQSLGLLPIGIHCLVLIKFSIDLSDGEWHSKPCQPNIWCKMFSQCSTYNIKYQVSELVQRILLYGSCYAVKWCDVPFSAVNWCVVPFCTAKYSDVPFSLGKCCALPCNAECSVQCALLIVQCVVCSDSVQCAAFMATIQKEGRSNMWPEGIRSLGTSEILHSSVSPKRRVIYCISLLSLLNLKS